MTKTEWRLPDIPRLSNELAYKEWKAQVMFHLDWFKLTKYVKEDVPVPVRTAGESDEDFADRLLDDQSDRLQTYGIIRGKIEPVIERLYQAGYDEDNRNPKVLWDAIKESIGKATGSSTGAMVIELSSMKSEDYTTLHRYLQRVSYLRSALSATGITFQDDVVRYWVVNGIKKQYPVLHGNLNIYSSLKHVTLGEVLKSLTDKANEEDTNLALANTKTAPSTASNKDEGKGQDKDKKPRGPGGGPFCQTCKARHKPEQHYHDKCKRYCYDHESLRRRGRDTDTSEGMTSARATTG